jgi:nucleoside-diphosphate-sugar epimerase
MTGELVVITGVNGFIGYATLRTALQAGFRVRGTVRRQELVDKIKAMDSIKAHLDNLELRIVKEIFAPDAFHGLLDGASYMINIASPLPGKGILANTPEEARAKIVDPAVKSTVSMLEEAAKTPTIKRVVVTSSIGAITPFMDLIAAPSDNPTLYTHESRVYDPPVADEFTAYIASKSEALNASLAFMEKEKPQFDLINIMPGCVIGPHEMASSIEELAIPLNVIPLGVLNGKPAFGPFGMADVHVQDVADVQVGALNPKIPGNRGYILVRDGSGISQWTEAADIVK